jgi:hypothetical protein
MNQNPRSRSSRITGHGVPEYPDIYYHLNNPPKGDEVVEFEKTGKLWFSNGDLHREDGPAAIFPDGRKDWFLNGKRHRIDGPAVIEPNGKTEWYVSDKRHREDGPAYEHVSGRKEWFINGKPHREDGPAVVDPEGANEWFFNGVQYTQEQFPMNRVKHVENNIALFNEEELQQVSLIVKKLLTLRKNLKPTPKPALGKDI